MNGKGDKRRPLATKISAIEYGLRHDMAFGQTDKIKKDAKQRLIKLGVIKR